MTSNINCLEDLIDHLQSKNAESRILIVGPTGTGKSTLGKLLGERLGIAHQSLDELHFNPGWQPKPEEEFFANIDRVVAEDRWILDGNYNRAQHRIRPRVTSMIWLNYPFVTNFRQLFRRTMARAWTGEELYNGCHESFRQSFFSRESILLWLCTSFRRNRIRYGELFRDPEFQSQKLLIELTNPSQARSRVS